MSLQSEGNKPKSLSLTQLVERNAEALETREKIPYQPVVYAIPEEWRKKENQLLAEAVQFQPKLYLMIERLATIDEWNTMNYRLINQVVQNGNDTKRTVERLIEQDGKKREEYSSSLSRKLFESLRDLNNAKESLESACRKWVLIAAAVSATSSVLACILCLLLAG